jgi:thiamine pyrophosphate-dependent acetolactate synthase large subunit-like protein/nitrite reductase/ring-hydroxylating ferredoxin subunit/rubredoxin
MARYKCTVCGYVYDEGTEGRPWNDLSDDWLCPICAAGKDDFEAQVGETESAPAVTDDAGALSWHRVAAADELPEGRVKTVTINDDSIALTHFEGRYGALANACPHQGGPLGEGSIENGWLRCPWHGWDFHPLDGSAPGGYEDAVTTYPVELRDDGVYVGLRQAAPRQRTVSDVMVETMVEWGVTHVFGMVGHSNLGLADAAREQEEAGKLSYIGIRHEGAAAFAASAYAKLTGRPAACLSIAGPGATNLLTGLWDAKVDRAPVLALTGQVDTQVLGPGAFQELDLAAAFAPVAAWSQTVLPSSRHAELMSLALKHAIQRRDVAHLVFPDEVQVIPVPDGARGAGPKGRLTPLDIAPPEASLKQAAELLQSAERPVFIVGHGARNDMEAVIALAEQLGAPVVTTFKGKGLISDRHPLGCGVLGRSGTPIASWFMNESDLLLVLGASFSKHTGITPKKPTIHVDYEALALGRMHAVDVPVLGHIGVTTKLLSERIADESVAVDRRPEIAERWRLWRLEKSSREADDLGRGLSSAAVFAAMSRLVPADAVIAVDVGNNTYSFGRYFECHRQSILMSGYLGSIGFGYPAAMGAWAAAPDRPVVAVTGDGGFGQYMAELTTAVKYGMGITHVLLNNSELGKISKEQRSARLPVWQTSLVNPDFAAYAESCGALGLRVTDATALDAGLETALAHDGPSLVEIITDPELV